MLAVPARGYSTTPPILNTARVPRLALKQRHFAGSVATTCRRCLASASLGRAVDSGRGIRNGAQAAYVATGLASNVRDLRRPELKPPEQLIFSKQQHPNSNVLNSLQDNELFGNSKFNQLFGKSAKNLLK